VQVYYCLLSTKPFELRTHCLFNAGEIYFQTLLLLLISVDGLVAPGISSSSNVTMYKLATCWLEPSKYRLIL